MRLAVWTLCLAVVSAAGPRAAGQISVLASGAVQGAVSALGPALDRDGHRPAFRFETSQTIAGLLAAGHVPDVLIAQTAAVDRAIRDGDAIAASRAPLGRIGIGVAVGGSGPLPDVSTVSALKAAVSNAGVVVVSRGASGAYMEQALDRLGVAGLLTDRLAREPRGDDVMKRLAAAGGSAIGFTMVSEIKFGESHGARYAGPLPAAMQSYTSYDVVVMTRSREPEAGRALVRALTTPEARAVFAVNGWEF